MKFTHGNVVVAYPAMARIVKPDDPNSFPCATRRVAIRLLRVLVVDNDGDTTESLTMVLRIWGYDVQSANGGAAAIKMAEEVRPDVLLLDVAMPAVTGCDVVKHLRRLPRFEDTRMVAVSGYADKAHQILCQQAGFDDFLAKPFELAALENLLKIERDRLPGRSLHGSNEPSLAGIALPNKTSGDARCRPWHGRPDSDRFHRKTDLAAN